MEHGMNEILVKHHHQDEKLDPQTNNQFVDPCFNSVKTMWMFDCYDQDGNMETKEIRALDAESAIIIFKYNFPNLDFFPPY